MAVLITLGIVLFIIGTFLNMFKLHLGGNAGVWDNVKKSWQSSKGFFALELLLAAVLAPLGFLPI